MNLGDLVPIGITLVVIAIVLSMGATILTEIQDSQLGNNNTATRISNITGQGITGTSTLAGWLPTVAIVIAAALVIGVVVSSFGRN